MFLFHPRTQSAGILFLSGWVLLTFELCWLRGLALAVGATPRASALTLVVVLLGGAIGAVCWPRLLQAKTEPIRLVGRLHLAAAIAGLLFFVLNPGMAWVHGSAVAVGVDGGGVRTWAEAGLAILALFPAAFLLGGVLPLVLSVVDDARKPSAYAWYTGGAVVGLAVTGFVLLRYWTLSQTVVAAVVGCAAVRLFCGNAEAPVSERETVEPASSDRWVLAAAGLSGLVILALEVLWARMLALVSDNSVYVFSVLLLVVLCGLSLSAIIAGQIRRRCSVRTTVGWAFCLGGWLLMLVPHTFLWVTDGLTPFAMDQSWFHYQAQLWLIVVAVVLPAVVGLGLVFPLAVATCTRVRLGRVVAVNTLGAMTGSILGGYLLLDVLGLWSSIYVLGVLVLIAGPLLAQPKGKSGLVIAGPVGVGVLLLLAMRSSLPMQGAVTLAPGEAVIETIETEAAVISVVRSAQDVQLRVNNAYTLGSARGRGTAAWMGHLPLLLKPNARSVLFLGMGTGVTASSALDHPVERVTVCELLPELFALSQRYYADHVGDLHRDPRVDRFVGDGRVLLRTKLPAQDVIIGDLFVPWKQGAGNLYSEEQFERVRAVLSDDGLFVQWLPLFQMTESEVNSVVRTMLAVFPEVTLWRGTFDPALPILGVAGQLQAQPLNLNPIRERLKLLAPPDESSGGAYARFWKGRAGMILAGGEARAADPLLLYYVGNARVAAESFSSARINREDQPFIEYEAPRLKHAAKPLVGAALADWCDAMLATSRPENDPYLRDLSAEQRQFVRVGAAMFRRGRE